MSNLFGIDLPNIIRDAFAQNAPLLPCVLTVVTPGTRTPAVLSDGTHPTENDFTCEGFINTYETLGTDGTLMRASDRSVTLMGASIAGGQVPKPSDLITVTELGVTTTYTIVPKGVYRDPAGATYTCYVRV